MNSSVLPIFRSDSLLAVLDAVLSAVGPISTSEVVHSTGLSQPLAHRELRRLTAAGILRESRMGRSALFEADEVNPAVSHLRALTTIAVGPQTRLAKALHGIPGIERALIFGSFAARAAGVPGTSPGDIDLLIIGTPRRRDVYDAIDGVDEAVRREVNVTFLRPERWIAENEELVRRVKANPIIELAVA
jgi:DNA-binding transcriptional ArsR family regulator